MTGAIAAYDQGCGSVHFPPSAREHDDDRNPLGVLSTCEHDGLRDGGGGADDTELYTSARSQRHDNARARLRGRLADLRAPELPRSSQPGARRRGRGHEQLVGLSVLRRIS